MPLYEFQCQVCGVFDQWRKMSQSSAPAFCPDCGNAAKRIFSSLGIVSLSSSLRLKQENSEPMLVKRDSEVRSPNVINHTGGRPWMLNH